MVCDNCSLVPNIIKQRIRAHPKNSLFSQIKTREREIKKNMDKYVLVDSKNKVIEKFRAIQAAENHKHNIEKDYYEKLTIKKIK